MRRITLSRSIPFHLAEIVTRKTDAEIQEGFAYARPRVCAEHDFSLAYRVTRREALQTVVESQPCRCRHPRACAWCRATGK